jgi:antitoxin component of MazEF toxin-antitoxin module
MSRKLAEKNIRKLTRTGNGRSVSVTLPIEMVAKLKWQDRQKVKVALKGRTILIRDWKK